MAEQKARKAAAQRWRKGIQLFFFIFIAGIVTLNGLKEAGVEVPFGGEASIHGICPFGGVVAFWNLATLGTYVKKVHESSVVLALIGIVLAILFGPALCGWICPFGTYQEWLAAIGRKIWKRRYNNLIPAKIDRLLRYIRYFVLLRVLYLTAVTASLVFQNVDPYYALFHFWTGEVTILGFTVLGAVTLASLAVERPFCKYICPYGAFQGLFNLFRVFSVRRQASTCISCGACDRACPMNIAVSGATVVRDHQCISCLKCSSESACPPKNTVTFSGPGSRLPLSTPAAGMAAALILFAGIGVSALLGQWQVTSTKEPALIKAGEFAGLPNPQDIRGSYAWSDVSKAFSIPLESLMEAFGAVNPEDKVNSLENAAPENLPEGLEIGTDSVRLFVALWTGLPHTAKEGTALPAAAKRVLSKAGKAIPPDITVAGDGTGSGAVETGTHEEKPQSAPGEAIPITGSVTFRALREAGYDMAEVEAITGKYEDENQSVKDFAASKGIEFSLFKGRLSALQPKR